MTWEPRPVPTPTPETASYWEGATEGELLLNECADCGLVYHYPRAVCPRCLSDDVEWIEASGTGTVYSYTLARQVPGWPDDDVPVAMAFVELAEGPTMPTVIRNADPEDIDIGMPVAVAFVETEEEDIAVPVFVPA